MEPELFKVMVDLIVFKALQRDGTLSFEKLADETQVHSTTVQYAVERLKKRDFYDIRAVPKLDRFHERLSMAVIGFSDAHPIAIERLERSYKEKPEVLFMIKGEKDVVLFMMDSSKERLAKKLYDIMARMNQKPSIYITSPQIAKMQATIPDKILDKVYGGLPERRARTRLFFSQ